MFPSNSLRHTRASSIPRQYYRDRTIQEERFSLSDAVHLKLRIQNLDNALAHAQQDIDVEKIEQASQSRPFHETTSPYVNGSEEFFLVVKSISRPDLIPEVYLKAYRAVLDQRPYTNEYRISDFRKGVDPIFSDIRALLPRIDAVCDTDLAGVFSNLEAKVKPFPFFQLPAELRLHVYTQIFPRENRIPVINQEYRDRRPQRLRLDILRANRQLHNEVTKYLFENRTLFMNIARDKASLNLSHAYISKCVVNLERMNPCTRQLFRRCEFQIDYLSSHTLSAGRTIGETPAINPIQQIFKLLPSLQTLILSFGNPPFASNGVATHRIVRERLETVDWLIGCIPENIDVKWNLTGAFTTRFKTDEQPLRQLIEKRGSILMSAPPEVQ